MTPDVERAYRRYDVAKLILLVAVAVMVLAALGLLLYSSAAARAQRANQLQLAQLLVECTTAPQFRQPPVKAADLPSSDCYSRQQAQQADVIGSPAGPLKPYIVLAATCGAAHPGDPDATQACVEDALARS